MYTQSDETFQQQEMQYYGGGRLSKTQINRVLNPLVQSTKYVIDDLNEQITDLDGGLNQYQQTQSLIPASQEQIYSVLRNNYGFTSTTIQKQSKLQTKLRTKYLHVNNLFIDKSKTLPQTKYELLSIALSNKSILKEQRKKIRSDDLRKKKNIMKQIQDKLVKDDITLYNEQQQQQQQQQQQSIRKSKSQIEVGQLTLQMIQDIRQRYFKELTTQDINEKFKRIKEIKDQYIPSQLKDAKEKLNNQQKLKLQEDLLSKKSQFNSYYQLLALEKTMRKVVALKLKPDIQEYSRFKGAERYKSYEKVGSVVKSYIHMQKNQE